MHGRYGFQPRFAVFKAQSVGGMLLIGTARMENPTRAIRVNVKGKLDGLGIIMSMCMAGDMLAMVGSA